MKKSVLGRGLGALLSDSNVVEENQTLPQASINEIDVNAIEVNPYQPRTDFDEEALQELTESIKTQGIIQPITVRKLEEGRYQLISGERRLQASKRAGLKTIPAYIRTANDQQMLEMALIENIQRENLNPIEIALSYQRLITECNLKQEELGERVSKNRVTVTNYLRLLKLPPIIQAALRDKQISMGHARAIINVENPDTQIAILKKILAEDLSVRAVENLVRDLASPKNKQKKTAENSLSYEIKQLQQKLSSHFGTKIAIKANNKNQGEIKIPFHSTEDLNRILELLQL
ncbi:ParB/RepB/Spo0J family partition protein [Raineya orbicola]|uniref:ParB/RepB/Spo0J family partition protein n=1 Tax=Raineya orbicola TaxID=2016530 RepID=A0A2N3IEB4_9BACT|nr:ParB/RepB/Spo0J family partition protein [Raineya orbicola]PKQ68573.1 ParB/RepB/Spo0J family partition protein [Raineya orbicola]